MFEHWNRKSLVLVYVIFMRQLDLLVLKIFHQVVVLLNPMHFLVRLGRLLHLTKRHLCLLPLRKYHHLDFEGFIFSVVLEFWSAQLAHPHRTLRH